MIYREATVADIEPLHVVRMAVKENALSRPDLITVQDYTDYLTTHGKGWLCEVDGQIAGFAIADIKDDNIWALFVHPDFEGRGIARQLHKLMLDWYFGTGKTHVWLGTAPGTRAEQFYHQAGWTATGMHGKETKFEMTRDEWASR